MKPRVLHVIPMLWSGAGRVVSQLAIAQRAAWDVALVTSGRSKGERDWPVYRRTIRDAGIPHHPIDFFDRAPDVFWQGVEALAALVDRWRPDVVHTHAGVPACAAAAVRDRTAHAFRHVNHVYNWGAGRSAWMDTMDLAGIRRADAVVCSSHRYRARLLEGGIDTARLTYVPWGLDLDPIRAAARVSHGRRARNQAGVGRTGPRVGFIGRIEPRKGQLELVRGFARLHAAAPGGHLDLVGPVADEEYAAEVAGAVRRLGLSGAVSMPGKVANPFGRLAQWDVFVSLSADEGQGLAALEAMALGVPVLARPVAGVEDYLEDGVTGWACPDVSPDAVSHGVRRVLADAARPEIVARARTMVDRTYTFPRTVAAMDRLYQWRRAGA
ncbi:MAG: glycosyltransferase family 4 protein [Vicinamibacterales bacterium]